MRPGADDAGCFPAGRHYPGIAHLLRVVAAGLADEWDGEHRMDCLPLVAIDTELTGLDPQLDRIIEIACVVRDNGEVSRHHWLVNPGRPIPQAAFEVHGIGDEDVADKPSFPEIASELLAVLGRGVPVAYNAEFDRKVLSSELARCGPLESAPPAARRNVEWLDPLIWARELHRMEKGKSLSEVCARLGIEVERAHRAVDDADAALRVMLTFSVDPRVPKTYAAFIQEQKRLGRVYADERRFWRGKPS